MSKVVHRKPVWGWSAILLSTLLLSPMATTTVLYAIAHAASCLADAQAAAGRAAAGVPQDLRRSDERESLRAVLGEHRIRVQLDSDPDSIALIVPARSLLLVPDDAARTSVCVTSDAAESHSDTPSAPRAPPFVSLA